MKRLLTIPLAALLIGCLASSCGSSTSKKENGNNNDSITEADSEAARLDSLRQDSIARRNFTSPDLAFHDLHGDVKQYSGSFIKDMTFDEQGNWTNEPKWDNNDKKYCPDRTKHPKVVRNKEGYITRMYQDCDADFEYDDITWKNGKIIKDGWCTYTFDDNGLTISCEEDSEYDYKYSYIYCNYVLDDMGNWIKRDVISKKTEYYGADPTTPSGVEYDKQTETRSIEYYKSKGGGSNPVANSAKQNQAIADYKSNKQKKTQETKPAPEESHNNNNYSYSDSYSYSSSDNMSFSSPQDVMRYLDGRTFSGGGVSVKIGYNTVYINGSAVSAAPVISNITPTTATIRASSPYMGGQDLRFYLNANSGTISLDSGERLYSR